MGRRSDRDQRTHSEVRARRYLSQMRPYTEEPSAEQFACSVLDWRRRGRPLRRPYGAQRPLSIPTMRDRAMQALYLLALDPVAETMADPNSYGFRRGRCTADAIE